MDAPEGDRPNLAEEVSGLVDRHGDEIVEEGVKTARFVRRIGVAILIAWALVALAVVGVAIFVLTKF